MKRRGLKKALLDLFGDEDDPKEPVYDPEHLGAVVISCFAGIGALSWLLWTLLVYEGGLPGKIGPALSVLFTSKTREDFGYVGSPYEMGVFSGWAGNTVALLLCVLLAAALHHLYRRSARKSRRRS